jgi:copper chaperone CopZ
MLTLNVTGMTCEGCVKSVRRAILAQDPDAVVTVERETGRVSAKTRLSQDEAIRAVADAGYEAQAAAS